MDYKTLWRMRKKPYPESYAIWFARLFSFPLTYVLQYTSLPPSAVSISSFLTRLVAAFFVVTKSSLLVVGILVWIGVILDCVDGELARVTRKASRFGAWIDGILDRAGDVILLGSYSYAVAVLELTPITIALALLATTGTTVWRYVTLITKVELQKPLLEEKPYSKIGLDKASFALILTAGALSNRLDLVVWLFAVVPHLAWIKNVIVTACSERG